jgi:hypothetical protein
VAIQGSHHLTISVLGADLCTLLPYLAAAPIVALLILAACVAAARMQMDPALDAGRLRRAAGARRATQQPLSAYPHRPDWTWTGRWGSADSGLDSAWRYPSFSFLLRSPPALGGAS